ncbi:MAG TPA: NUDIX domain-containing protein [Propionibacteriaceae bacterium]
MPTPDYILDLRRSFGPGRLLLPGVSAVVIREDLEEGRRHLLMTRRSDNGLWSLPAGIVEPAEQPATTIVRELMEETGVSVRVERLALLHADPDLVYPNGDRCQFISMTFRCRYLSGEAHAADEESTDVAWFDVDDLPAGLSDEQLRRIECGLAAQDACVFDL